MANMGVSGQLGSSGNGSVRHCEMQLRSSWVIRSRLSECELFSGDMRERISGIGDFVKTRRSGIGRKDL